MTWQKYLGVIMDEHINFNILSSTLASSANRALGSICTIFHNLKELGCFTFTKMYHSGVTPILDYASGIWGYNWNSVISSVLTNIGQEHAHQNKTYVNVNNARSSLCN